MIRFLTDGLASCVSFKFLLADESSRAPALWRHDLDDNHQNMVFLSIVQGRLAMFNEENLVSKHNVNVVTSMSIWRGRSSDSRQVRFFLDISLYFFIKLRSLKVHFYLLSDYHIPTGQSLIYASLNSYMKNIHDRYHCYWWPAPGCLYAYNTNHVSITCPCLP